MPKEIEEKNCKQCNKLFKKKNKRHIYCSKLCTKIFSKTIGWLGLRFQVLNRDNFTCQYCGRKAPNVILEIDHKLPKSYWKYSLYEEISNINNLITACWDCNHGKGDRLLLEHYKIKKC